MHGVDLIVMEVVLPGNLVKWVLMAQLQGIQIPLSQPEDTPQAAVASVAVRILHGIPELQDQIEDLRREAL